MTVKLMTEHNLELLSLTGGCTCLSESTLVKLPHCCKSHVTAHILTKRAMMALDRSPKIFVLKALLLSIVMVENHVTSKQQQWRIPLKNPSIQVRFVCLIFPIILVRLAWGLKQIPEKIQQHAQCMRLSDKDLVKKLLTSNRKIDEISKFLYFQ